MRTIITILTTLLLCIPATVLATEFSVISYNVFLRSPTWIFHNNHDWRTEHIPEFLQGYDAVVLQEAFSEPHRESLLSSLSSEYPYNSGVLGEDGFLTYNGGVIILSRWPIQDSEQLLFEGCEGSDCIVQKGVIYTAIRKNSETVHLFGLHMQAQPEYAATRRAQFPQMQRFIDRQTIPSSDLVLVAGDFNVDYFANNSNGEFSLLTGPTSLVLAEIAPAPSYDSKSNSLVEEPATERLDYVFYSARHLTPTQASNKVLHFRKNGGDLSDHHAVAGHFKIGEQP